MQTETIEYGDIMASKTREKLIEVARQLFAIKGVAHTTMNDIASASAKGRRTIYTYFKNKREIYNAVLEGESDRMVESMRLIATSGEPVEKRLADLLRARLMRYYTPTASASAKAWLNFDKRRIERVEKLAREKESAIISSLLAEGVRKRVFSATRCRLMVGFMHVSESFNDTQVLALEKPEERDHVINAFIEFVITDLCGPWEK